MNIENDIIQQMSLSCKNSAMEVHVGTFGIVPLQEFDSITESLNGRDEMVVPKNHHDDHKFCVTISALINWNQID